MPTIVLGNPIPSGGVAVMPFAGTPSAGTSAIQTLTFGGAGAAGDTFQLSFDGAINTTAAIAWSATNATLVANIDAALEALPNIGTGGVTTAAGTMTAGIGTITVTFAGNLAVLTLSTMVVSNVVTTASLTVACATTTPGVKATYRKSAKGALVSDTTNAILYQNTGTPPTPTWSKVGAET